MSGRDDPRDEDERTGDAPGRDERDRTDDVSERREVDRTGDTTEQREGVSRRDEDARRDDDRDDDRLLSRRAAILLSALVALVVTVLVFWVATTWAGRGAFFEELFRVAPTVEGGGVGTDWQQGNTIPWLDALIALIHAADVLMGVFILIMVFLHWSIFRRLAGRMRRPDELGEDRAVATDGSGESERGETR